MPTGAPYLKMFDPEIMKYFVAIEILALKV